MRLLALLGSICALLYIVGSAALLINSFSRWLFCLSSKEERTFWFGARLGAVILWPLMLCSEQGRVVLETIWKGEDQ